MTIEQAITKAIEGGWEDNDYAFVASVVQQDDSWRAWRVGDWQYDMRVFLDPTFWQSLGKALGWKKIHYGGQEGNAVFHEVAWLYHWKRLIVYLADGKTVESFFEKLTP